MICPHCHSRYSLALAPIFEYRRIPALPAAPRWFGLRAAPAQSERLERIDSGYWCKCLGCDRDYGVTIEGSFIPRTLAETPSMSPVSSAPIAPLAPRKPVPVEPQRQMDDDLLPEPRY